MTNSEPSLGDLLSAYGVTSAEIAGSVDDGTALLLAIEQALLSDRPRYTVEEILERTPIDPQRTAEMWRSLGFPDPPEDEPFFTDADVQILGVMADMVDRGASELDPLLGMSRVAGQSMARFAAAQVELYLDREAGIGTSEGDGDEASDFSRDPAEVLNNTTLARTVTEVLPTIPHLLEYVWHRHMLAAVRTRLLRTVTGVPAEQAGIGFADLVGFTALSQQISPQDLSAVVDRFESHAFDTVARLGGRVVKMIGDEVMFAVDDPRKALEIGLELSEVYRSDDELSEVRVGVSWGSVLEREGDFFGPVVNTASRIVNIAYPGTVVVSEEMHDRFADDDAFTWKALRRKTLKDIGRVTLWSVRRRGDESPTKSVMEQARDEHSERVEKEVERLTGEKESSRRARSARREAEKSAKREAARRAKEAADAHDWQGPSKADVEGAAQRNPEGKDDRDA